MFGAVVSRSSAGRVHPPSVLLLCCHGLSVCLTMELLRLFIPWISLSFVAGCFAAYFFVPPLGVVAVSICTVSVCAFLLRRCGSVLLVCVCVVALLLGVMRVLSAERHLASSLVADNPGIVVLTGRIVSDVEQKSTRSRYVVSLVTDAERATGSDAGRGNGAGRGGETERGAGTESDEGAGQDGVGGYPRTIVREESAVLVYEPYPTSCVTGEDVSIVAQLREPEDFVTEAGRVFRYKQHLRQSGVHAVAFVDDGDVVCDGRADSLVVFAKLRSVFVGAMHAVLPAQEASLLGGLLLGLRGSLSVELLEAFRVTGLVHIIVLSGYNITLVAEAVRRLLSRLPRFVSLIVSFFAVIAFVFLAGAQTAAIRAGSMASLSLIARATYRENDGIRALLLVAALMVLYNPDQVLFSVSFHLSFLATLGLLVFSPIIERRLSFVTERFQVREIVATTVATQVFLLPYLAYSIGEVSLIGILANIIILPIIPVAMAFGAAVTFLATVSVAVASVFAPIAYIPLAAVIAVATHLSAVPYAAVLLPEIPLFIMAVLTVLLVYLCFIGLRGRDE